MIITKELNRHNFKLDNSCWNDPCDSGDFCEPKRQNSHEYKCTCKAKYLDPSCKSG